MLLLLLLLLLLLHCSQIKKNTAGKKPLCGFVVKPPG
jgi:hypothetical protein